MLAGLQNVHSELLHGNSRSLQIQLNFTDFIFLVLEITDEPTNFIYIFMLIQSNQSTQLIGMENEKTTCEKSITQWSYIYGCIEEKLHAHNPLEFGYLFVFEKYANTDVTHA